MNKLPSLKSKQIIKLMREAGFHEDHRSGSHVIMHHDGNQARVSIPYHRKDLPQGTIQAILRAAGMSRKTVLEFLYA